MSKPKTETLQLRINASVKAELTKQAEAQDLTASDVVRQLVSAYVQGRVTIIPPKPDRST